MPLPRQSAADRRRSLLRAALDLFSEQGYAGTTTRSIAARVGVTEGLLFKHFPTKRDLLVAVVAEFGPARFFPPPAPELPELPVRDALARMIVQYLDGVWENRVFMTLVYTTPKRDHDVYAGLRGEFVGQWLQLHGILQERTTRGELRPGSAEAAAEIISLSISGFLQRAMTDEPRDWPAARDRFVAHLMNIVLAAIATNPAEGGADATPGA
jgi:AcrR family transcriptional regulator